MHISKTISFAYLSYLYANLVPRVLVPFTGQQEKEAKFDCLLKNSFISWYCIFFISLTSQERSPKHCGRARLWRKNPPYFQKTRGLRACLLYTAVSRSGFTHSQKTAHARIGIQPEPEFSDSGVRHFRIPLSLSFKASVKCLLR